MKSFRKVAAGALAGTLLLLPLVSMMFLTGCRKEEEIFIDTNLSPDTRLASAPAPYSQNNYRVHLYWDGTDPDGYVVGYYFAWDDSLTSWEYTSRSDSLFKALIDTAGETRRHTFYVRAVDNEGKIDASPAWVRFDAWTVVPVIDSLIRVGGPEDPTSPDYNPGYKDTVLMGSPCTFSWIGYDPDGLGAPIQFSYRLDSDPFKPWSDVQEVTLDGVSSNTHFFYVKGRDETGAENFPENYKFVMNYEPDTEILEPTEPSGTLTVDDRDTIWFRWTARDKEEIEGLEGGVSEVWIVLDGALQRFSYDGPPYEGEFYYTSNTFASSEHYIGSVNNPTGGNKPHEFRIYSKDVENRFEKTSAVLSDREYYRFSYNHPPGTVITYPENGATDVPQNFTVTWTGTDSDGTIAAYQYVLDPIFSAYQLTEDNFMSYTNVAPGEHEFRVRARDNSDCWEEGYQIIRFTVTDAK